ncbi:hypothetical protein [Streptomyces sp. NPDC004042]|uniref:hypothetical protein n=1 Tax=Streptomyces sp. NPDC004042 TaxID=3154451 RepID=UPI0033AC0EA1
MAPTGPAPGLAVTPPDETVLDVMNLDGLHITVPAGTGNAPDAYVDPVGHRTGTGTGK